VAVSGGNRDVTAVQVDLTAPDIRLLTITAGNVGAVADFSAIIGSIDSSKYEVLAAVNGAFFSSYNAGAQPILCMIKKNGVIMHYYNGMMIGFGADNSVHMNYLRLRIIGYVDNLRSNKHSFYVHNLNNIPASGDYRETIVNPLYGSSTGDTGMVCVTVRGNTVTAVSEGDTPIPSDGYVYLMPQSSPYNDGRFYEGAELFLEYTYEDMKNNFANITDIWKDIPNMTGCGPSLILNGVTTADAASEGWKETNLTRDAAKRSFIGFDQDKKTLVFGSVGGCTIRQLAEVAAAYGLHNAMNLDGGASSAIYYGGKYLVSAGRKLSNIIVVVRVK
jgi:hypothetical protein